MSLEARPRRSVLYVSGASSRVLDKARTLNADCLIFDSEDAVAPDMKEIARANILQALSVGGYGRSEIVIRINGLNTPWGEEDLKSAMAAGPDALLVPKIETPGDVATAVAAIDGAAGLKPVDVWAMMETPLAILHAEQIAASRDNHGDRLRAFVMGTNDLVGATGVSMTADRIPLLPWLSQCVLAARAFGLSIIDGVYNDFHNEIGFRAECEQGRALGMDGKTLIHPTQITPCDQVFSPSEEEVAWARKILEVFEQPENQGKGAVSIDGRMVELVHAEMARKTIAIADVVAASG